MRTSSFTRLAYRVRTANGHTVRPSERDVRFSGMLAATGRIDADWVLDIERGARSSPNGARRGARRGGRVSLRPDLGPFPSVDRSTGAEPMSLVGDRRHRGDDESLAWHRRRLAKH